MPVSVGCGKVFGCHRCEDSLRQFIEIGMQALVLRKQGYQEIAFKELESAIQLARCIAYASQDKQEVP